MERKSNTSDLYSKKEAMFEMANNGPRKIEVLVPVNDEDAETIVEALNFKGKACDLATKDIERSLGTVQAKKLKPEYNAKDTVQKNIKLG